MIFVYVRESANMVYLFLYNNRDWLDTSDESRRIETAMRWHAST
jgi:hypothetical protein